MEQKLTYLDRTSPLSIGSVSVDCLESLLKYLKGADDNAFEKDKSRIAAWVSSSVKDPVLARQLRKTRYKKNFIEFLTKRIDYLQKVNLGIEKTCQQVNLSLYVTKARLILDKEKCIRCDISHTVCPKESVEVSGQDVKINNTCVLCGICVPFCPTGALTLEANEEAASITKDTLPLPKLAEEEEINGIRIKRLFDGSIQVNEELCPEDCEYCVAACPIGIIERDGKKVTIDKDKCVYCSACSHACPKSAITVKRNRILHEEGFSAAWTRAIEKFLGKEKVNVCSNEKSVKKIKGIVDKLRK